VSSTSANPPRPRDPLRRRLLDWFLGSSVLALLASIVYPIVRFVSPPRVPEATTDQVEAGALNDPALVANGYKIIRFGSEPVVLIKLSDTDVRAFSATCTHLACIVEFRKQKRDIYCNCHGGEYNLQGRNIAGPPPRPLTPFKVDLVAKSGGGARTIVVSRI
jgi:Rieske Fe-S protein